MVTPVQKKQKTIITKNGVDIKAIFETLNLVQVEYCLLHGYDKLDQKEGNQEINLLVNRKHMELFSKAVTRLNFVAIPSLGHFPHNFFVAYDDKHGRWVQLDVVTDLYYGRPVRRYHLELTSACLCERCFRNSTYVLLPEYGLLTLLLHCILDDKNIFKNHSKELIELHKLVARDTNKQKKISELIDSYLAPFVSWHEITKAAESNQWHVLTKQHANIARNLFLFQPFISSWRKVRTLAARKLRPFVCVFRKRGVSIVLMAPKGAGKTTLARSLIHDQNIRGCLIYMGTNLRSSTIGLPTTSWFRKKIQSIDENASSLFKTMIRVLNYFNRLTEQWYRIGVGLMYKIKGRFVIFDKYMYDFYVSPRAKDSREKV